MVVRKGCGMFEEEKGGIMKYDGGLVDSSVCVCVRVCARACVCVLCMCVYVSVSVSVCSLVSVSRAGQAKF